ncbi:MAG: phosphatase PAP2 family protein [Nitrospirae bacterium]|nr:phosphatase PAP2 family protein [Nitrospirota bacterium]
MPEGLQKWDDALFLWVNNRWESGGLDPVMMAATDLGNGGYLYPIGILAMIVFARTAFMRDAVLWIAASLAGLLLEGSLKHLVARPRPLEHFSAAIRAGQTRVHVLGPHLHWFSFPSGHATTAFCAAVLFGGLYPRLLWPFLVLATMTGVSRVYVGAHFPTDVLAGALIGTVSGLFALKIVRPRLPLRWSGATSADGEERKGQDDVSKNTAS